MFIIGRIALSLLRFDRFSRVRLPVTPIGVVSAGSLVLNLFPGSAQSGGAGFFTYKGTLYTLVKSGGTYVAVQKAYSVYAAQPAGGQQQLAVFNLGGTTYLLTSGSTAGDATPRGINPEWTGRMEDLDESILRAQQAVDIAPQDHPSLAAMLSNLGRHLYLSSQPGHREQALESFQKSWNCLNGIPFRRVFSALQAIRMLKSWSRWSEALVIAKQAISLLPLINNRSLSRDDQRHVASTFSGLAADACSLSLQAGDEPFEALELLELGRGVIMGLLIDDRSDISRLEQLHAEEPITYDRLRNEVNAPVDGIEDAELRQSRVTRHLEAVKELDECIGNIRKLPGHQRFLLGPTLDELKEWASEGPIVVVNVTDIRSDAIIVTDSAVTSIGLPMLTETDVIKWIREDLITYESPEERGKKNKRYIRFLSWLWSSCVEVILQKIHDEKRPEENPLPRIWWIGVGIANYLPFHAAGNHSVGSTDNTLHWAISSYTPTIKALAHARRRVSAEGKFLEDKPKLLIVTMPETPGQIGLRGVEKEMSEIQGVVKSSFSEQSLVQPNAETVLAHLTQCGVIHFACHGLSDQWRFLGRNVYHPAGLDLRACLRGCSSPRWWQGVPRRGVCLTLGPQIPGLNMPLTTSQYQR